LHALRTWRSANTHGETGQNNEKSGGRTARVNVTSSAGMN
jgi:hypothetical protein